MAGDPLLGKEAAAMMLAFCIWELLGLCFAGLGVWCHIAKKQVHFWANTTTPPKQDVRGYNRAQGRLWCGYGAGFCLLGLLFPGGEGSARVLLAVLGLVLLNIALMACHLRLEARFPNADSQTRRKQG